MQRQGRGQQGREGKGKGKGGGIVNNLLMAAIAVIVNGDSKRKG